MAGLLVKLASDPGRRSRASVCPSTSRISDERIPQKRSVAANQTAWTWALIRSSFARSRLGGADGPGYHQMRLEKEVLIVGVPGRTVSQYECRLATSPSPAAPLGVIGRGRRDVPHVDNVELANVHAEFHRGRAIYNRQFGGSEILFPFLPFLVGHLSGVFACLESTTVTRDRTIELNEEWVGMATITRWIRNPNRVVKCLSAVPTCQAMQEAESR